MKIGIETSAAIVNPAGTGNYVRELVRAIIQYDKINKYCFYGIKQKSFSIGKKNLMGKFNTLYRDIFRNHIELPTRLLFSSVDLVHYPAGFMPFYTNKPSVVFIHDAIIYKMPNKFKQWQRFYANINKKIVLSNANKILTNSECSKNDIAEIFGIDLKNIIVTPLAASDVFCIVSEDEKNTVKSKYGLDEFILTVGILEPRKNYTRLIKAFKMLKDKGIKEKLVHVGPKGWMYQEIFDAVKKNSLCDDVVFLDYVPVGDLVCLYNTAKVFVYPSLYEGFGLPILEAMKCGCPVVTSNVSSMPEVAGCSALLINPLDEEQIAAAIERLINDKKLSQDLRREGFVNASRFSWQRTAEDTVRVYRDVFKESKA